MEAHGRRHPILIPTDTITPTIRRIPARRVLDALGADHFDFGWLDASAFDALDAGIASFDAGFDASAGHAGGNGGDGDGGGGNGGGGGD